MKLPIDEVFAIIAQEREYQDAKWPKPEYANSIEEYVFYMEDYIREIRTLLSRNHREKVYIEVRHILRDLVTLGVACAEENGLVRRGEKKNAAYIPIEVKGVPLDEAPWARDGQPLLMWNLYTLGNPFVAVFSWTRNSFLGDLDNKPILTSGNTRVARIKLV